MSSSSEPVDLMLAYDVRRWVRYASTRPLTDEEIEVLKDIEVADSMEMVEKLVCDGVLVEDDEQFEDNVDPFEDHRDPAIVELTIDGKRVI